jgi:hypothetical protein
MSQSPTNIRNRVTGLGELLPVVKSFTLGRFLKIAKAARIFSATFFYGKKLCIDVDKNGLGDTLGDFFTSSSGHPEFLNRSRRTEKTELKIHR